MGAALALVSALCQNENNLGNNRLTLNFMQQPTIIGSVGSQTIINNPSNDNGHENSGTEEVRREISEVRREIQQLVEAVAEVRRELGEIKQLAEAVLKE